MLAFGLLIALVLYVGLAWTMAKLIGRYTNSKLAKYLLIAIVVLIPTWDIIPGRLYFQYLCATATGIKVYKTVEIERAYFSASGQPDEKKLKESYDQPYQLDGDFSQVFHITKFESTIQDRRSGEMLGRATSMSYFGGWLNANLFPQGPPITCPDNVHTIIWREVMKPKKYPSVGGN